MRINNNMSAVITNNQLLGTESSLADVMEKLSSGFSINHASDDPSGIAIAGKMQAQIDGLDKASTNSSDGISVLQTAEGALNEVTDMIQRMRELSVQAANGTNSDSERETIQKEIDSLLEEIDRVAETTEFNTINLLNGSLDNRTYAEHATRMQTSNTVPAGLYTLTITSAATRGTAGGVNPLLGGATALSMAGTMNINGYGVEFTEGMSREAVYEAMRDACEKGSATISDPDENISIYSLKYGAKADLEIEFSSKEFAVALGFPEGQITEGAIIHNVGDDAVVELKKESPSMFGPQATTGYDGNHITVTDVDGFELSFLAEASYVGEIEFNVTDIGSMTLHVGANKNQNMEVRIAAVTTEFMYIDDLSVTRVNGPEDALDSLDTALNYVTSVRSQLGAYENRLEHTTKSLDTTEENMTSAISRVEDADMATTMVEYTKLNVLEQAGTSALAQANELPQLALQLLQ
ncbi:flagellin N-terminal helical domain-containing protein [Pseudobutyrivibrio sp. LB2011]|uniref:flagellin N-terminal helical domain-containing protein n=1 Tax=Pseudobutyrivibrio sp. LB2011 TaxID=1408312 RepID=UPI0005D156A5|nr:flagellin [Pseudobutyrivibrio sp. LB2011]